MLIFYFLWKSQKKVFFSIEALLNKSFIVWIRYENYMQKINERNATKDQRSKAALINI